MGMVDRQPVILWIRAVAMRMSMASGEDLHARFLAGIGGTSPAQPGLLGLHRRGPGPVACGCAVRPIVPDLPQQPGQEHQGSKDDTDAAANPT